MPDPARVSTPNPSPNNNGPRYARDEFPLDALQQVPLFMGLSSRNLKLVSRVVKRRTLVPGELLVSEDEVGNTLFLIMEGAFKVTVRKGEGTVLLGLCGQGELLGELAAIDGHMRSATVAAQTACIVGMVNAGSFWDTLWPITPVPMNMAHLLAGRVRRLTSKVQAMATLGVRGRLAFQIVSVARDHAEKLEDGEGYVIPFGLTQVELAQMVGTSRVQVNQLMKNWTLSDILTSRRNHITIHRLDLLCEMFPTTLEAIAPKTSRELK